MKFKYKILGIMNEMRSLSISNAQYNKELHIMNLSIISISMIYRNRIKGVGTIGGKLWILIIGDLFNSPGIKIRFSTIPNVPVKIGPTAKNTVL